VPVDIFESRQAKIANEIAFAMWKVVAAVPLLSPDLVTANAS
jgi:hypothetical protein